MIQLVGKELICNEIDIIPIIFGSVGYFLRTFDFEMLQKEEKEIGFNDLDFIVSQLELKILKNEFINLGYSLDLTWIDGYVGFVKGDKDNPYTIEDTSGIEIGPKRFELELDGFIYDFDALDEFVELDENTNIMVDGGSWKPIIYQLGFDSGFLIA